MGREGATAGGDGTRVRPVFVGRDRVVRFVRADGPVFQEHLMRYLLWLLMLAPIAGAQEKLEVPKVGEPHKTTLAVNGYSFRFSKFGDLVVTRTQRQDGRVGLSVTATSAAGGYIVVSAADQGRDGPELLKPLLIVVTVKSELPPPRPVDPKPIDPVVATGKFYFVVVRDPTTLTPAGAKLLGDTPYWDKWRAAGHDWDFYPTDVPANTEPTEASRRKSYIAALAGKNVTPPGLLVIDIATGKVLRAVPLPADKAAVDELVKGIK